MPQIPLNKFPFLKAGMQILETHQLSIEKLDENIVYNEIITQATRDIISSFKDKTITPIKKMHDDEYEVVKFYLTLFILKSMPSRLMYRYWIKAYMARFEWILVEFAKTIEEIDILFNELKMPHVFVRIQGLEMMAIKINDYMDFVVQVNEADQRFKHLLPVNLEVVKGRVFIPVSEINNFRLIIIKLVETKIYELLETMDLKARSNKIDKVIEDLQGYLIKDPKSSVKMQKQLEYGEVTPQMQMQNDKIIQMFKQKPGEINVSDFPPCINRLLNKILKKQILNHPENILLATYLAAKGYTTEQMTDVFMAAPNADQSKISYNLEYVFDKKMKPYNCNKAGDYHLCYKDEFCESSCLRMEKPNPMSYRK